MKAGRKGKGRAASYDEDAHLASIITTMDSDDSDDDATNGNDNDRHNDKRYKMDNAGDFDDEATGNGRCGGKGRGRDSGEVELGLKEYAREKRWLLETLGKSSTWPRPRQPPCGIVRLLGAIGPYEVDS